MKVSVFGLGYVGAVSCACLPELGHEVVGVDINPLKVELIASGQSPVVEEGIEELIASAVKAGKLTATQDVARAVRDTEISLISVATPALPNFMPDLTALDAVVGQIGAEIAKKDGQHTLVIRSTVAPGTTRARIAPLLEQAAGRKIGDRLSLVFNPEFLREGSSVSDFHNPPQTIVGSLDEAGVEVMKRLYTGVPGSFVAADVGVAESVKYLCNVFHALKIVFANEAGAVLKEAGLDSRDVLALFCEDKQLNISKAYLRPGFAFGGSCLPKEVKGFLTIARERGVDIPVLGSLLNSNEAHISRAYDLIAAAGRKPVALFGLAFKPGTDDLRDSPLVVLAERLLGKGFDLAIYDKFVKIARLLGKNKEYIDREIPHLDKLLQETPDAALARAEIVVVGHADAETRQRIISLAKGARVVDLNGYADLRAAGFAQYEGICW
ncbi:nucleotide sugar dehydrogenase [Roseateles puraquae]|jgi:GDP-mannose 6-dehydrogenase|uniref:UDP-glucose 6-dehydrogenase n=1 Tax=Roseateles puraquae TaxID=431059 RepID=A0A254NGZ6_9BURK|nr:nucleotide sugar dehydrogenase [Roseateles puraquae]MDG0852775.1 UDP-glucose/GDP-mannose dehydrogenase family protein [Roseateles puraquae]OWR05477.1 GDP-mannose dehydrogenase [Roseateles puraquae]